MLAWTIYISFFGALLMMLLPRKDAALVKVMALLTSLGAAFFAIAGSIQMEDPGQIITLELQDWIPSLGISFHLAADGISSTLAVLTGLAAIAGVLFSWNVTYRVNEFFALYFALIGGVFGVFLSFDLFLLFVFYEIAIIPKYFLIAIWGSTRKEYGAMKLALYSFVGSAMVLIGLIAAFVLSPGKSFTYYELAASSFPPAFQAWAFPLTFVGFTILAGIWPLHTWAPTGHVAAPTAASMLLAGVVMKLGAYGGLRVSMVLFPEGFKLWQTFFVCLAVIGILYGAMVALTQRDFKFVIGYSSVSHMGFVLLGLACANVMSLSGAVLQMFSHGIIAGLLFAVVGRMVYDRTHSRDLSFLEELRLRKKLPFAAGTFLLASLASMGFPGFSGFIAELTILIGAWQNYPMAAILTALGILIGIAFTLRALQKSFFNNLSSPEGAGPLTETFPSISFPEKAGTVLLLGTSIVIGVYPKLLLDWITPAVSGVYFQSLK